MAKAPARLEVSRPAKQRRVHMPKPSKYLGKLVPVQVRLPEDMLADLDKVEKETRSSRSDSIREFTEDGLVAYFAARAENNKRQK